jgi:hypothetical protein
MAQTWGETLGSSYASGRAIGEDFATMRFQRRAAKIREQFEQRAATEQVPIDSFLPEMETALREAAERSGATRRGIMTRGGQTLDQQYGANLRDEIGRLGQREAATALVRGDVGGGQGILARNAAARGDFEGAQNAALARDTVAATSGAMNPDGTYDMGRGAQGLAGVAARYGDVQGANAQQAAAPTFRLQAAAAVADQLQRAFTNPQVAGPDRVRGMFANLKNNVPELGDTDVQVGEDGVWTIYTNGKATGSLNPQDPGDVEELNSMLASFTQKPGEAVQSMYNTRLQNIADSKKSDSATATRYSEARIAAIQKLSESTDLPKELLTKVIGSGDSGGSGGWQLQEIGAEPNTYMVRVGGETFVVKTNVAADPGKGEAGGTIVVTTGDNKPVPASAMDRAVRNDIQRTVIALGREMAKGNYEAKANAIRTQLELLNSFESQERGRPAPGISRGGGSRGERNNNPGNIEDRGQFRDNPDYLGSDGRFARFRTPEAGNAAQAQQLERYMDGKTTGQPLTTVQDIVGTWSPQADPTNQAGSTGNYVNYVASRLGVRPGDSLSKADIPRLQQAMAEFETGNTQRGSIMDASRGNVVAGGSDEGPAPATLRKPVATAPRRGISREGVLAAKGQLDDARATYDAAKQALERFDADFKGGGPRRVVDPRVPAVGSPNLTATQQAVRDRLAAELDTARERMEGATEDTRGSAQALRRKVVTAQTDREAADLYKRYGAAADFMRSQQ